MAVHEIARRLIGGVWRTVDAEEDGGGNGGSQPNPIVVTVPLEIDQTDATEDDLVVIKIPASYVNDSNRGNLIRAGFDMGAPSPVDNVFTVALNVLSFIAAAGEGAGALQVRAADSANDIAEIDSNGALSLRSGTSDGPLVVLTGIASRPVFRADSTRVSFTSSHAVPADNTISNGEVALWFDQTNGAAKLMIKGKSADGTVVTGQVALA